MRRQSILTSEDQGVLTAWRGQVEEAARTPGLMRQLLQREHELLPRFAEHYKRLKASPRRVRRALQRKWKQSLAGVALLLALGAVPAQAAIINVNGTTCNLVDAITAANNNTATGGCTAGSGADTLVLAQGSTHILSSVNNTTYGKTGLPVINSAITIDGNGSMIRRSFGGPNFRIFAVGNSGNLTLQKTTVSWGRSIRGGDVYNKGTLTVTDSTISAGNSGYLPLFTLGGGVYNKGTLTVTDSTISGNRSPYGSGGGVFNTGTLTLTNSTISGNVVVYSGGGGGGVRNTGTLTLTNSTISGNFTTGSGGGVYNGSGTVTLNRTLISGNQATQQGPEIRNNSGTVTANNFNLFGYSGGSGVTGFTPGATDIVPGVGLSAILNTTLANNGGNTETHALVSGSPAIDAAGTSCSATDQRGFTRPVDGNNSGTAECDIGSFEFRSAPLLCNGFIATIFGTEGNDVINGTADPDVIAGLGGNDTINGGQGNDIICGGRGRDTINGGTGNDRLLGQRGRDTLNGDSGDDILRGGGGDDTMDGGIDTDTCNGGADSASGVDTDVNCETVTNVP